MSEKKEVVYFDATKMNPQELFISVKNLAQQGYNYLFDHRGWKYFALNTNGRT